jgi:hypothetical protein
MESFPEWQ